MAAASPEPSQERIRIKGNLGKQEGEINETHQAKTLLTGKRVLMGSIMESGSRTKGGKRECLGGSRVGGAGWTKMSKEGGEVADCKRMIGHSNYKYRGGEGTKLLGYWGEGQGGGRSAVKTRGHSS